MDENTKVKVEEKIKELMALAKKKKNVLEYQEIVDCFAGMGLEVEQIERTVDALEKSGVDVLRITEEDILPVEDDEIILSEEDEVDVKIEGNTVVNAFGDVMRSSSAGSITENKENNSIISDNSLRCFQPFYMLVCFQ